MVSEAETITPKTVPIVFAHSLTHVLLLASAACISDVSPIVDLLMPLVEPAKHFYPFYLVVYTRD